MKQKWQVSMKLKKKKKKERHAKISLLQTELNSNHGDFNNHTEEATEKWLPNIIYSWSSKLFY